jgi:hypothetical protein
MSNADGPIDLLLSTPNHTLIKTLLYNLITFVSCGFPQDHTYNFSEILMLNHVKESGRNPYIEQWLLVQDVQPSGYNKDIHLPHLQLATHAYATC